MDEQTIKIGRRVFTILFPDLLRPLSDRERSSLRASIKKCGVQVPVVVDEDDGVVDGLNRLTIAAELGLTSVVTQRTDRPGMALEEKRELAYQLNDARRHLKVTERKVLKEQQREFKRHIIERRAEGRTLEAIAEETGASYATVQRATKQIVQDEQTAPPFPAIPDKVGGKDGKMYPTKKPRKQADAGAAKTPPAAVPEVEQDAEPDAEDAAPPPVTFGGLPELVVAWKAATWQARREFDAMRERGELEG